VALWLLRLTHTLTYLLTLNTRGAQKPCPGNDFLRRLPASGGILSLDISWVIKHSNKIPPHIFGVKLFNAATSGIAWRQFRQKSNMAVVKMKCTDFTALWMIKDNFQYTVNNYKWPRTGRRRIIKMVLWSRPKPEVVLTSTRNKISASVHRLWPCFRRCQSNVTMSCNARKRQRPKNQTESTNRGNTPLHLIFGRWSSYSWVECRSVGFGASENTFIAVGMSKCLVRYQSYYHFRFVMPSSMAAVNRK